MVVGPSDKSAFSGLFAVMQSLQWQAKSLLLMASSDHSGGYFRRPRESEELP